MKSYQNLVLLKSLYQYKSLGFSYIDPINVNSDTIDLELPSNTTSLHSHISQCHLCDLSKTRNRVLNGFGNIDAKLMFIDAYPSMIEDETGDSFSGNAGVSLKRMIENVLKLSVNDVYLTHAIKCRPSSTHKVLDSEFSSCKPFLLKQIELINPDIIVCLGELAYTKLIKDSSSFEKVRGQRIPFEKRILIPIYHPSDLLRNPSNKVHTMKDLQVIKGLL